MRIILSRHGQVEGIDPPRFRGRMELVLTDLGRHQATALGAAVATQFKSAAIYTSPMQRCRDTGASIAQACGVPAQVQPGIDDFDYGEWQWKTHEEARTQFPRDFALWKQTPQWMSFPGGESLQAVALRTADALRQLLTRHAHDTVVLVAHDSVNRVILLQALDLPLSAYWRIEQSPCCINELELSAGGHVSIARINDTSHLRSVA